eukprot:m.136582 g.136582  ORF g.136582 m.136582 type:complete len:383 (+) comp20198_c0_seq3:222-1370(+)
MMSDPRPTFIVRDAGSSVYAAVAKELSARGWRRLKPTSLSFNVMLGERNNLSWTRLRRCGMDVQPQAVNYYRGSNIICRKAGLTRTLRTYAEQSGEAVHLWYPESFVIQPAERTTEERERFLEAYDRAAKSDGRIWIAKPSAGAKGEAIFISDDADEILARIDCTSQTYIVQKYLERPMLLPGSRKFDIRIWVLLDHNYRIKMYKEGVLRTASDAYAPDDLENVTSHLTNHCVQEAQSTNFGKFEEGNEMFFDQFRDCFRTMFKQSFDKTLMPQMQHIIRCCFAAIQEKIEITARSHGYHSFQLFGFDFMVDDELRVWLVEINGAPASAARLLKGISSGIVDEVLDPLFRPKSVAQSAASLFQDITQEKDCTTSLPQRADAP